MLQYHILMKRHEKLNTRASKETDPVKKQCLENRALDLLVTAVSLSEKSEFRPGPTRQRDEAYREKMGCFRSNILNYVTITHQPLLIDLKEDKKKKNKPPPPRKKQRRYKEHNQNNSNQNQGICEGCKKKELNVIDSKNAKVICTNCGLSLPYTDKDSQALDIFWSENSINRSNSYSYKKSNHMIATLERLQAKEYVTIPQGVYDKIKEKMTRQQLDYKDPQIMTPLRIRKILKDIKRPKYYSNVHLIRYELTGHRPPQMTLEQENQLLTLFDDICLIYTKLQSERKIVRSNMLSYNYILKKSLELLGLDEIYEDHILLLKHRERLEEQEAVWKIICEHSPRFISQKLYFVHTEHKQ